MVGLWWYGEVVMSDYRVSVSVSMPEWFRQAVEEVGDELDLNRSELFRKAAREFAAREGIDLDDWKSSSSDQSESGDRNDPHTGV